ncbi:capsular polysaccharide export protein, LipB/KpsS family [Sphingomonas pokkalii]|uniref:Beta-3-deoxy-D-manno-oct-2-ulosonic acid transferase n=1 Tax=Sphingomonas pokkalii TaxID=2175090 RepID=A0A2U0SIR1_9SPHN|nr:beta-3-deoxy-D-manno-oct-2-ulosonic acid transferase [Sphingomonas pokkalii]PVX31235.1 beta-3-deoxy-D-manno-oct-2-ulosonic acid transferase [Sphingomonas pokkalii]
MFLRVPPFPRARALPIVVPASHDEECDPDALAEALRRDRIGGAFWGAQPRFPAGRDILLAPADATQRAAMVAALSPEQQGRAVLVRHAGSGLPQLASGEAIDPWALAEQASLLLIDANDELALVAALAGRAIRIFGPGRFDGVETPGGIGRILHAELLAGRNYRDPFTGAPCSIAAIVDQLAAWRRLIDGNRGIGQVLGVAGWKRETVEALLWNGGSGPRYRPSPATPGTALLWRTRVPGATLRRLERRGAQIAELEDGFLRSAGLGANCVPPLSVAVDFRGIHFDPAQPSDLEVLIETAAFDPATLERASALIRRIVDAGLGKYGRGLERLAPPGGDRRHVLVTGQVEDDRSVRTGGGGKTNLELLQAARAAEPDAFLIYKPHPDVEAGHRKGAIDDGVAARYADRIERQAPISSLLDIADAVHVLTSLAGFEALLRNREVITHGVPFYAGWGLTTDLGPVPARRTARRTLPELVAAALILYPRYLDPVTGLPCDVERLVERMIAGQTVTPTPLERLRTAQGMVRRMLVRIGSGV